MTTKHDPRVYQAKKREAATWIKKEFPFIWFADLRLRDLEPSPQTRRIGSFEIYLLCPSDRGCTNSSTHLLLHSKLMTRRWPVQESLVARVREALPSVVSRVELQLQQSWSSSWQAKDAIKEAEEWGLGSWAPVAKLSEKIGKVAGVLAQGERAAKTGNKAALREAVKKSEDLHLTETETVVGWRDDLKQKNLVLFNMKHHAHRLRVNAAYLAAVRLIKSARVPPLRQATLEKAIEKAQAAEIAEEDLEEVIELESKVSDAVYNVDCAMQECNLEDIVHALEKATALSVMDPIMEKCLSEIAALASKVRVATETNDLVELNLCLRPWGVPEDDSSSAFWSLPDFAAILAGEATRKSLQLIVDEAEKRYAAENWDALQKKVDLLSEIVVEEEMRRKWSSALKRELKRRGDVELYTMRLKAALQATTIPIDQLEEAITNAVKYNGDENLIQKARTEVSTAQQRLKTSEDAAAKRVVDRAEVKLWQVQSGRIRIEEVHRRSGPLWQLAEAVRAADAAHDADAMEKAIEGWTQDNPESNHEAFSRDESPTKAFRFAQARITELRVRDLRKELQDCVDTLAKPSREQRDVAEGVRHIVQLARSMLRMGWELKTPGRARLLALRAMLGERPADTGAARFGSAVLRTITDSCRVVFLLDQTKSMRSDVFNNSVKPVVAFIATAIEKRAKGVLMGAVANGTASIVQELTTDLGTFKDAVSRHAYADCREAQLSKSMRKALKLFTSEAAKAPVSERDRSRFVFHFTSREPDSAKDARKALRSLEDTGVTVVSIGVGSLPLEDALQECSSDGLVFKVSEASMLQKFVADAFESMDDVLAKAESLTPEETLRQLETLC